MAREIYIPQPEGLNAEFYEQLGAGKLHLQCCSACGQFRHPPRYLCAACGCARYEWRPSAGRGRLHSWTVTHFAFDRGWSSETPYVTAIVELDEGVRIVGHLADTGHSALQIGEAVELELQPCAEGFVFLAFHACANRDEGN